MKRLLLFLIILIVFVLALFLTGCTPTVPPDVQKIIVEITGFKQEVSCVTTKTGETETFEVLNGKCGPYCPSCSSCCPQCPQCPQCPGCDSCCNCEECEICETCGECPTCPSCPCYSLQWGKKLWVYFKLENEEEDDVVVDEICSIIITFDEGGAKIEKQISIKDTLLAGEEKNKEIEINLVIAERVIFVEIKN